VQESAIPRLLLIGIFGGLFFGYVGLTSVIPVLPSFARDRLGASNLVVGLIVTATAVTALLIRPVAGSLADRYGHRLVMQVGALIVAAGGVLYFLPLGLIGLVAVRLLLGAGEASLFTAGAVWTVSIAPHHRRGQLIGLYGVSMWGGISVGTLLGATLLHFGYNAVWGFSAAAPLVGLVLISAVPALARAGQAAAAPGGGRGLLLRPALIPGLGLMLAAAGYAGLASFVVLDLRAHGIGSGVVVLSCFSAVYAATRLFIGHLPDTLGPRRVAAWSGVGEAVGLLIIAVAPNLPVAIIGALVMGVGFSLLHPSLALMVMNRTDSARQGAALGAYTSFWDLGLAVWGPVMGVVATGLGYPAVFVVGAGCALAASGVALGIRQPTVQPGPQPGPQPATAS
jgi:MFS family permease